MAYTQFDGPAPRGRGLAGLRPPVVMGHGVLLSQRFHWPLAKYLAEEGFRVVTVDFLGHGRSDRPAQSSLYAMDSFSAQLEATLDHLGFGEAALIGTSLGATAALSLAVRAPRRVRGLVLEMPALEGAVLGGGTLLAPLLIALNYAPLLFRAVGVVARAIPSALLTYYGDVLLDPLREDPLAAAAVLHGLFYGKLGPTVEERRTVSHPALVIGHRFDPIHPFGDARRVAEELPQARLLEARSLFELRLWPSRLRSHIGSFLRSLYSERGAGGLRLAG